ncbi:MAG TPA: DUF2516 family protein [Mycobacteriales bacterium]|nr:DUF2516 family protein [Mycobacteriales bacterium]
MLRPLAGIFFLIYAVTLVLTIWALVDAGTRSPGAFVAAEKQTKQFWMILLVVAALAAYIRLFTFIAIIAALVYLLDVRPAVRAYK